MSRHSIVAALALLAGAALPLGAGAYTPANSELGKHFGTVKRVAGSVTRESSGGRALPLAENAAVFVGDTIRAEDQGETLIATDDGGMIGVRPRASFTAVSYSAKARPDDEMVLKLLSGSLRIITGWIGTTHREGYRVDTLVASIGIRGTDHEPYVLPEKAADTTPYEAGTYDKVNRGRTAMKTKAGEVEVEPGRVAFAREITSSQEATRGMLTLLMPELLDRIPDFYVAGRFERELDEFSRGAEAATARLLAERQAGDPNDCTPSSVARDWIARFDAAIKNLDPDAVLALFAPGAQIRAVVKDSGGASHTESFSSAEFARSVQASIKGLTDYTSQRQTLDASAVTEGSCGLVTVKSRVVESGKQHGTPYRTEADESYVLERREGKWLAIESVTTQR
jgi:hypothetical protein